MARNGTGVKKASNSSIEISFMYKGKRCRERIKLLPTNQNMKRAEAHKKAIEVAIMDGTFDYAITFPNSKNALRIEQNLNGTILLSEYLDIWMSQSQLKASTENGYRKIIEGHLKPNLGGYSINQITRPIVRKWISQSSASNKTIANILSPLRKCLQDAVNDCILDNNPLHGWSWRNKVTPPKTKIDPFTHQEQQKILSVLEGQGLNLIQFALWTGLRTSELVALDWEDVNLARGTININKALTQAASEAETTKTHAGQRSLKLLPPALDALKAQQLYTLEKGCEIFQNPRTKERWAGDQPIRKTLWMPALKKAQVRYRRPYQLRHTFASMMVSSGENIRWLSHYLGHADTNMTLRTYAQWLPDANPEAGMKAVEHYTKPE